MKEKRNGRPSTETDTDSDLSLPTIPGMPGQDLDEFNPEKLRLSQAFNEMAPTKKLITSIPVHRPNKQTFVRCHPAEEYWFPAGVLDMSDDNETYIVAPSLHDSLNQEIVAKRLVTSITRQGVLFLWPIRLPGADGKLDEWNRVAGEAAKLAITNWVRLVPNRALGSYEISMAMGNLPEPEWPDLPVGEILKIAFKDKLISDHDHPVLRNLRGQV